MKHFGDGETLCDSTVSTASSNTSETHYPPLGGHLRHLNISCLYPMDTSTMSNNNSSVNTPGSIVSPNDDLMNSKIFFNNVPTVTSNPASPIPSPPRKKQGRIKNKSTKKKNKKKNDNGNSDKSDNYSLKLANTSDNINSAKMNLCVDSNSIRSPATQNVSRIAKVSNIRSINNVNNVNNVKKTSNKIKSGDQSSRQVHGRIGNSKKLGCLTILSQYNQRRINSIGRPVTNQRLQLNTGVNTTVAARKSKNNNTNRKVIVNDKGNQDSVRYFPHLPMTPPMPIVGGSKGKGKGQEKHNRNKYSDNVFCFDLDSLQNYRNESIAHFSDYSESDINDDHNHNQKNHTMVSAGLSKSRNQNKKTPQRLKFEEKQKEKEKERQEARSGKSEVVSKKNVNSFEVFEPLFAPNSPYLGGESPYKMYNTYNDCIATDNENENGNGNENEASGVLIDYNNNNNKRKNEIVGKKKMECENLMKSGYSRAEKRKEHLRRVASMSNANDFNRFLNKNTTSVFGLNNTEGYETDCDDNYVEVYTFNGMIFSSAKEQNHGLTKNWARNVRNNGINNGCSNRNNRYLNNNQSDCETDFDGDFDCGFEHDDYDDYDDEFCHSNILDTNSKIKNQFDYNYNKYTNDCDNNNFESDVDKDEWQIVKE